MTHYRADLLCPGLIVPCLQVSASALNGRWPSCKQVTGLAERMLLSQIIERSRYSCTDRDLHARSFKQAGLGACKKRSREKLLSEQRWNRALLVLSKLRACAELAGCKVAEFHYARAPWMAEYVPKTKKKAPKENNARQPSTSVLLHVKPFCLRRIWMIHNGGTT